jgi:MFS family permease
MAHQQSTSYALEVDDDANGDSSSNSLYRKFRDPAIRLSFLALLVFAHISVNLCRYAFAVLEEEFETILGISEFQYAVLTGSIFVLFYSVSGVPISIAGDLINHWMILCGSILLTAFSTFFMGFATEFWGLAVCRAFQGIGLSAVVALGGSILVRLFQPKHQGVVMAFFAWGNYAGYGINYSVTLMIISVPALLSAICLYLLKKNTRDLRNVSDENSSESNSQIESASQPLHFRDNYGDDRNESIFHTVWEFVSLFETMAYI